MLLIIICICLTFIALILTIIWLLKTSGLFHSIRVHVKEPPIDECFIAYKFQRGPYSTAADIFKDIMNFSPSANTIGIYYDDPNS
ncbi:unnamed protein product, partial [Didymodactylos carnosus]